MSELRSYNSAVYDWLMEIPAEQWCRSHFSGRVKCDILLNNIYEELTEIPCKHVVAAIYNMSENSMGVGIPEHWVHAAYRLETWAHVYSFKINPCNSREMWPVVESTTVIIPPNRKPQVGRPPKKKKKSHDDITSQSCSSGKLSRKGMLVKCSKCGNLGHNRKGCRGQGGASQAGGSSQAGARNISSQAASARNDSSQAAGSSQPSAEPSTATGARNASSQATGASQPSATPSTTSQGPT
ncbi:hypothetical protein Tco_0843677 [Tanacetum coccineum]|uniref:CCHC-type domain-containing protein n=1 Tax=Tanacetum coccineum TaxID=301880 RepID=A0ABQ5B2Y6_9ASTR